VACCFVTPELSHDWLLHEPMSSPLQLFLDKRGTKRGQIFEAKVTDATMLKKTSTIVKSEEATSTPTDRRDGCKCFDGWHAFGTIIYSLKTQQTQ